MRRLQLPSATGDPLVLKRARRGQLALSYFRGDLANVEEHFAAGRNLFEQPDVESSMYGARVREYERGLPRAR